MFFFISNLMTYVGLYEYIGLLGKYTLGVRLITYYLFHIFLSEGILAIPSDHISNPTFSYGICSSKSITKWKYIHQ
jgi:hypothetical protein